MLMIHLGINSRSSTEGCFSTAKERNKMADERQQFVFYALRNVLRWCRDVARSYLIKRKAIIDTFTVILDRRL